MLLFLVIIACLCQIYVIIADRYIFVNITTTPLDGETYCHQTYGTHLASIHSPQDNDLAVQICDPLNNTIAYGCAIGLIDGTNESNTSRYGWQWTDSTIYDYNSGYTNWHPKEPNEFTFFSYGEDCVMLSKQNGTWSDCPCNMTSQESLFLMPFLCNAPTTTSPTEEQTIPPTDTPFTLSPSLSPTTFILTLEATDTPTEGATLTNFSIKDLPTVLTIVLTGFLCCVLFACFAFCVLYKKKKGRNIDKKGYQQPAAQMYNAERVEKGTSFTIPSKQTSLSMVPSHSAANSQIPSSFKIRHFRHSIPHEDDDQYHEELGNMVEVNNTQLNDVVRHMETAGADEQDDYAQNQNGNGYEYEDEYNQYTKRGEYQANDNGDKSSLNEHDDKDVDRVTKDGFDELNETKGLDEIIAAESDDDQSVAKGEYIQEDEEEGYAHVEDEVMNMRNTNEFIE